MVGDGETEYTRRLGAEIRARRLAQGMSLRALAKALGLSGHGTLVDYEHGRRIPPEDLAIGCERIFQISDGALRNLREKALTERANQQADLLLNKQPSPAAPEPEPARQPEPTRRPRRWLVATVVVAVAIGLGIGIWRLTAPPAAAGKVSAAPPPSRTVVAGWGICWGGQVGRVQPTNAVTYAAANSLQITVTRPFEAGDFAVCTHHGLSTLHAGMKVTVHVRVSAPGAGNGLGFFVYDSHYNTTWAPETPKGDHTPLPTGTDWQQYVWTVPNVDKVVTLGMEVYSTTNEPLIVWLGNVNW